MLNICRKISAFFGKYGYIAMKYTIALCFTLFMWVFLVPVFWVIGMCLLADWKYLKDNFLKVAFKAFYVVRG